MAAAALWRVVDSISASEEKKVSVLLYLIELAPDGSISCAKNCPELKKIDCLE